MNPFFSFVAPCCDVEPYIEECLRSILNQSFQNWKCLVGIDFLRTNRNNSFEHSRKRRNVSTFFVHRNISILLPSNSISNEEENI